MSIKHTLPFALIALVLLIDSCDPIEEEITFEKDAVLTFSTDTVLFDTLFTSVGSITKRLRIFNRNEKAVNISRLYLGKGDGSEYSITVNGERKSSFEDEVILGNDSLLLLIDVIIDPQDQDLPFLVKDSVVVESNGNFGHVKLVTWGQDAVFLNAEVIDCNSTWTADRPYVIYNFALVDTLCTLQAEPGTRIFLDNDAALFVKGSLQLNGTLEDKIIVRNTRLDPKFDVAPGQWDGIYYLEGSFDNSIEHAVISNGTWGLRLGVPDDDKEFDLVIGNTLIEHMSVGGIMAFSSDIRAYNTVVYNCGLAVIGNYIGGNYEYEHCTFVNDPSSFFRDTPSFQFSDVNLLDDESTLSDELDLKIVNSVLWGAENNEILIALSEQNSVTLEIHDNIIKSTEAVYEDLGNILSTESNFPGFFSKNFFDYQIDSLGNARDQGENIGIDFDILGTERDEMPDFGAYERKDSIP